jgi:hypothetical protein
MSLPELRAVSISYHRFSIPKRTGGKREIAAPDPPLMALQRRIAQRLLAHLRAHPAAMGFERARSIATHAALHTCRSVVLRLDIQEFFPSITAERVEQYFAAIGWDAEAAQRLTSICTSQGCLPQGAPTSPRLSNLVNYRLDARLAGLAESRLGLPNVYETPAVPITAVYTRYADDLTFSFDTDSHDRVNSTLRYAKWIVEDEGYRLHTKKKLRIMRRHDRHLVTGLVVNDGVRLPRETRRWLRAVEHRIANGGEATLTAEQLHGWRSLQVMIASQSASG